MVSGFTIGCISPLTQTRAPPSWCTTARPVHLLSLARALHLGCLMTATMVFDGGGISCVWVGVSTHLSFNAPSSLPSSLFVKWHAEVWWIFWINFCLGGWQSMLFHVRTRTHAHTHTHKHSWYCGQFFPGDFLSLCNTLTNNTTSNSHIIPPSWSEFDRAFMCLNGFVCVCVCVTVFVDSCMN